MSLVRLMDIKVFDNASQCPGLIDFVKQQHYLKSVSRGSKVVFALYEQDVIVGVALFGHPVGRLDGNVLELKRFVMLDGKGNRCSQFLGHCVRYIKKHKLCDKIVSYADPEQGHEGTIYKASNFQHVGAQKYRTPFFIYKGRKVYSRNVYGGSEQGKIIQRLIKKGVVKTQYAEPKHIFIYNFDRHASNGRPTQSVGN